MGATVRRYGRIMILAVFALASIALVGVILNWAIAQVTIEDDGAKELPTIAVEPGDYREPPSPLDPRDEEPVVRELSRSYEEVLTERDYNQRVWNVVKEIEQLDPITNELVTEEQIGRIVEVGCGICYPDERGEWQLTDTAWQATESGFVMNKANYQLAIGQTLGSWLNYTIDGDVMQLRPAEIRVEDNLDGAVLATANANAVGVVDPCNPSCLVFANAFGEGIDLALTAHANRLSQDVIFQNAPVLPRYIDAEHAEIQLLTEMNLDDYIENQDMGFVIDDVEWIERPSRLRTEPTRDHIEFVKVIEEDGELWGEDRHAFVESTVFDSGIGEQQNRTTARKQLVRDVDNRNYLVESLDADYFEEATYPITWDYETVNGTISSDTVWHADATYYVSSTVTLGSGVTLRIEPGTIVKLGTSFPIPIDIDATDGELIAQGTPYAYIIFTSWNDNTMGETIAGLNSPAIGDWSSLMISQNSTVQFCKIAYAVWAIDLDWDGEAVQAVSNNIIRDCYSGVWIDTQSTRDGTLRVHNNLFTNIYYPSSPMPCIHASFSSSTANTTALEISNNTIEDCKIGVGTYGSNTDTPIDVFDNLFSSCDEGMRGDSGTNDPCEYHNAFYDCTYNLVWFSDPCISETSIDLTVSPYDPCLTYLGDCFLNDDPWGGALLIDAGYGDACDYYEDPCSWSVYHVPDDSDHLFDSSTTLNIATTWQPNYGTCDIGTTDIGYHHPRVDYLLYDSVTASAGLTISPGTVVAIGSSSYGGQLSLSGGIFTCDGTPDNRINLVYTHVASSNWDSIAHGYGAYSGISLSSAVSDESTISFCNFNNLRSAMTVSTDLDKPIHDNIFSFCDGGIYPSGNSSIQMLNNQFVANNRGVDVSDYGSTDRNIEISNCAFSRNDYGVLISGSNMDMDMSVKNCVFTDNVFALKNNNTYSITMDESHNAFYSNYYHYATCFAPPVSLDLDPCDFAGDPCYPYASLIDDDDFYQDWEDFADRFYLPTGSALINNGDPLTAGMPGYTTSPSGTMDTGIIDIGYHYPITSDTDGDGLQDYEEYWLGTGYDDTDSDDDVIPDGWEVEHGFDPLNPDEDNNGTVDGLDNEDGDDFPNFAEMLFWERLE